MRLLTFVFSTLWEWRKTVFFLSLALLGYGLFRQDPPPQPFPHADKFLHLAAFLGFSLCTRAAFNNLSGYWLWPGICLVALGSEWLQNHLQPFRQFSWGDIEANLVGVALALTLYCAATRLVDYLRLRKITHL